MKAALRAWLMLAVVITLGPSAWAVVAAEEAWPWTSAPMFAEPHDADTALYQPRIIAMRADGTEVSFDPIDVRFSTWHFYRLFLVKAYGSASPVSPHGAQPDDTPETFEKRMGEFFTTVVADCRRRGTKMKLPRDTVRLRVELKRITQTPETHVVGHYDMAAQTFAMVRR